MNRLGVFRGMLQWLRYRGDLREFWETGLSYRVINGLAVPTYYCTPDDFVAFFQGYSSHVERLYGCGGIGAHLQEDHLAALMADPEHWPTWREVLLATCDHPSVVGVSRSLLALARNEEHSASARRPESGALGVQPR